jgi:hypothetical protein
MIEKDSKQNAGIKSLVKKYKSIFEIPENLNHYSKTDYKIAEKKFLKYALYGENPALRRRLNRETGAFSV